MLITDTGLSGLKVVRFERRSDDRGHFARTFCAREFQAAGLDPTVVQANLAFNRHAATVRGLHFQVPPAAETKLVRCTRGAILDVAVDLRPESPTFLRHFAVELTPDNDLALFVPARFAHGYQVLQDDSEVTYQVGEYYSPGHERGLRFDDPRLGIRWPLPPKHVSAKDSAWPLLDESTIGRLSGELSRT
jgi:dTDP-4-dehydrorhamnose 3,5-epimerase